MKAVRTICCLILLSLVPVCQAAAAPIGPGNQRYRVDLRGQPIEVFTFRPACPIQGILLVFHGLHRGVENYRDAARPLATQLCMIVVAPLFDEERFPGWRYQRGGIVHRHALQDPQAWTGSLVLQLVSWVRQQENRPLPYSMIGHSAGGQFLSRLAAFTPTKATRIVVANPSSYVFANLRIKAPFGMGGVYPRHRAEAELRRYLQTPVTIFLGKDDVGDKDRDESAGARAQGETRLARGLNAYYSARALARSAGWPFNWRLVRVARVGHSARKMLGSKRAVEALSP